MNVLALFQNDQWKFTNVRALTVIFIVRKCKMRKKIAKIYLYRLWRKPEFILINIFSPTCVQNLVTLVWKMRPGMPKEAGLINGPLCAYLIRQNLHNGLVQDLRAINVIATFQNDPWKFTDVRMLAVIFHVQSWTMPKKIRQNFLLAIMKNPVTYVD